MSEMCDPEELASTSNEMRIENIDPELDIRSELFNPIKALLSPEIQIPIKDAPQYNNVAHYESAMRKQQTGESVSSMLLNTNNLLFFCLLTNKTQIFFFD